MNGTEDGPSPAQVDILLFRMGGVALGAVLQQIAYMALPPSDQEGQTGVVSLVDVLDFRGAVTSWLAPKALYLAGGAGQQAVVVDNPEEIVSIDLDEIQSLPDHLLTRAARGAFLGAFVTAAGAPVLLLDLYAIHGLAGQNRHNAGQQGKSS
ncbi:MAG: hypothetical protein HQL87_10475 [Magnetococcales bacterium]|nr:hypothetical protein [Magnetococcales bacterium]